MDKDRDRVIPPFFLFFFFFLLFLWISDDFFFKKKKQKQLREETASRPMNEPESAEFEEWWDSIPTFKEDKSNGIDPQDYDSMWDGNLKRIIPSPLIGSFFLKKKKF